jgi:hypothetical protein
MFSFLTPLYTSGELLECLESVILLRQAVDLHPQTGKFTILRAGHSGMLLTVYLVLHPGTATMTDDNQLTLDDIAYTADVNLFLKTLARILTRLLGQNESGGDNENHEADDRGQTDEKE